ncbi:DUF4012 domain-containing protein [Patescibacteria group bacterium]
MDSVRARKPKLKLKEKRQTKKPAVKASISGVSKKQPVQKASVQKAPAKRVAKNLQVPAVPVPAALAFDERAILAHAEKDLQVDSLQRSLKEREIEKVRYERSFQREFEKRHQLEDYVKQLEQQLVKYLNRISGKSLRLVPGLSKPNETKPEYKKVSKMWRQKVTPAKKALIIFIMIALSFVGLVSGAAYYQKGRITSDLALDSAKEAVAGLFTAFEALSEGQYEEADLALNDAKDDFIQAQNDISSLGDLLVGFVSQLPGARELKDGRNLLKAGEIITTSGEQALEYWQRLQSVKFQTNFLNTQTAEQLTLGEGEEDMQSFLNDVGAEWPAIVADLSEALALVSDIKIDSIPTEYQQQFYLLQKALPELRHRIETYQNLPKVLQTFFALEGEPQKYLLLFQNSAELRATGGFIGTYGVMDMKEGEITQLDVNGIYDPDGLLERRIVAPEGLSRMIDRLFIRDANWWPDFPTSAQKVKELFQEVNSAPLDGVIAFTPAIIQGMLKLVGELEVPGYDVVLTADNFMLETQVQVDKEYDRELNKPKQFLADALPLLLQEVFEQEDSFAKLAGIFGKALAEKDLQIYSEHKALSDFARTQNWDGALNQTSDDILMIVNTNIESQKSDQFIKQAVEHKVMIDESGDVTESVKLTRQHTGTDEWPSGDNHSYARFVVPAGSRLISATGFADERFEYTNPCGECEQDPLITKMEDAMTIHEESGTHITSFMDRSIFANWISVKPQSSVEAELVYEPDISVKPASVYATGQGYTLVLQKQAGASSIDYDLLIEFPESWQVSWNVGTQLEVEGNILHWRGDLTKDEIFGILFAH